MFVYELSGCGFESCCSHLNFRYCPVSSKEFLDIQVTIECRFLLKCVRDMIRKEDTSICTVQISTHNTVQSFRQLSKWLSVHLRTKWLWFRSCCSHLNFRFGACFEQGVPWHSGNYIVWIQSKTRTWHDKNIEAYAPYI